MDGLRGKRLWDVCYDGELEHHRTRPSGLVQHSMRGFMAAWVREEENVCTWGDRRKLETF